MFFISIKEINRPRKEVNRLLSKEMSNIYLKVTIDKKLLLLKKLRFWKFKKFFSDQVVGELQLIEFSNLLLQLKNQGSESKTVCGFFISFTLKGVMTLNSKSPCFLLDKNMKFDKNKTELKMENSTHSFEEVNHVLQLV